MSSMIRILLSQCGVGIKQESEIQFKNENVLGEVSRLVYTLLWKGKMQLLETIFVNLKREQEKVMQKGLKGDNNKGDSQNNNTKLQVSIYHSELLNFLNLQNYMSFISSKTTLHNHQVNTINQIQQIIEHSFSEIQQSNLIRSITFWLDHVFVQRRITGEQIALLQSIMDSINKSQDVVLKCQLVIRLARENVGHFDKGEGTTKQHQQLVQQGDSNYKWIQQQLIAQGTTNNCDKVKYNVLFSDDELLHQLSLSSTDTLLTLYKNYLSLKRSSSKSQNILHKHVFIISSLLSITRQYQLEELQSQVREVTEQIRKQSYNLLSKLVNQSVESVSLDEILYRTTNYWLTVCFVQQLLQFFTHNYHQQLSLQSSTSNTNNNNNNEDTTDHFITLQTIFTYLGQLYGSLLDEILHQVLQQGLQNDVKTNYYLSQKKLFLHVSNLTTMGECWIGCKNRLSRITKAEQCELLLQSKCINQLLTLTINRKSTTLNNICKSINSKLHKIISFLSLQSTGVHNRLLSLEEYQAKKLQKVIRMIYCHKSNNQQQSNDKFHVDKQLFLQWFVYDYQWKYQKKLINDDDNSQQQQKLINETYNKLHTLIFPLPLLQAHKVSSQHSMISSILNLPYKQQSTTTTTTTNTIRQTFSFHSPTFNNQYLTFNYIYGETKDRYFYHNHHYSHVLLNVYSAALDRVLGQQLQSRQKLSNTNNRQFILSVFNTLRNFIGHYAKDHLLQANSKQFYQYLNMFKLCYISFNKQLLLIVPFEELILTFDLILNEVIVKENHPLIRQYIEIIMARLYVVIKEMSAVGLEKNQSKQKYNPLSKKAIAFYQCRNRMINMLDYDQENVHNLNIGVPILILLGYELIDFIQNNPIQSLHQQLKNNNQQQNQVQDQFGSKQIKPFHELDIQYILVKYISCHIAYMRTICQYYMSKFVKLMNGQIKDVLLMNLVNFWHSDKDSLKIMTNIELVVEGFKKQMNLFHTQSKINNFYLCFEKVQEKPSVETQLFLTNDSIKVIGKLLENGKLIYSTKLLFVQKMLALKSQLDELKNKLIESLNKKTIAKSQLKKVETTNKEKPKKIKPSKEDRRAQFRESKKQKLQQKFKLHKQEEETQQVVFNQEQTAKKLTKNLQKSYQTYQQINEPNVIIIATLLQKVHNFGYLVRTLTNHNAMLTVPNPQPFVHPECKQLLPRQEDIDVKVIEVKEKHLESFIRMYQQRGYPLIALEQCSKSITLEKTVFPQKYMLLLGNQRIGAPASLLNMADILVQIPQIGKVRSLNVHVSMVICFWQYLKQKNQKKALQKK